MRNAYEVLVGKPEAKENIGVLYMVKGVWM
jgi:hypothetical protein